MQRSEIGHGGTLRDPGRTTPLEVREWWWVRVCGGPHPASGRRGSVESWVVWGQGVHQVDVVAVVGGGGGLGVRMGRSEGVCRQRSEQQFGWPGPTPAATRWGKERAPA